MLVKNNSAKNYLLRYDGFFLNVRAGRTEDVPEAFMQDSNYRVGIASGDLVIVEDKPEGPQPVTINMKIAPMGEPEEVQEAPAEEPKKKSSKKKTEG